MRLLRWIIVVVVVLGAGVGIYMLTPVTGPARDLTLVGDATRGEYLIRLGGCATCHTDAKAGVAELAGGAGLPTDNLVVTINGVHRVVVTSIVKAGGALLTLPPDLEVFDVRFEAQGSTQVRAIALVTGAK